MEQAEASIRKLLSGEALDEDDELCDFTLAAQNEATAAKGVTPTTPSDYIPILGNTVTYIAMGVLFNSQGEVLMMQEAKSSCAGQWYLPAGRVNPGENLEEAVVREVLEETGLEMQPTTLLMVECASKAWFRFVFTGNVTGGKLKTPADADSESLQAKWIQDINELSLRASDIHSIIEMAREHQSSVSNNHSIHSNVLPAIKPHKKLLLRLVVCARQKSSNRLHVLLSEKTEVHLPMCEINHNRNLHSLLLKFMIEIFGADVPSHKPHGLMSVEHCGKPEAMHDGLCLTMLVSFKVPLEDVFPIDKYSWGQVSRDLGEKLLACLPKNMTLPLHVIR
ncbi:8-oxo-dGDP phosphatase NUDT18 isoform X1 [Thrips palmi]|uniref:8-oxo-dGDP phosphatase NUDT18 isoform X1 n=1 Tax=Thrips palmi TaxID=161013 RepID=A0A6P9A525_THRPL|nr:8-oxo-dGDP phosphatase NUDT18 isoform X1 [Thrips palmi]